LVGFSPEALGLLAKFRGEIGRGQLGTVPKDWRPCFGPRAGQQLVPRLRRKEVAQRDQLHDKLARGHLAAQPAIKNSATSRVRKSCAWRCGPRFRWRDGPTLFEGRRPIQSW